MGKKQGQAGAQRVKGNAQVIKAPRPFGMIKIMFYFLKQPSSSAKAAEMLQQISSGIAGFSFNSDVAPIGKINLELDHKLVC